MESPVKRTDLKLDYIATGCGHCGTGYVARLLTSAGVVCGHEHIFHHSTHKRATDLLDKEVPLGPPPWGIPWDQVRAESSWPALFHLTHPCVAEATIIHIVRNPLLVLRSWMYGGDLKKGLPYYVEQFLVRNWFIEEAIQSGRTYIRYQVEGRLNLIECLGLPLREGLEDNPTYNQHVKDDKPTITWDDVELECKDRQRILGQFIDMSIRYGYGGPS
jgi:hypothetical protein